MRGQEELGCGVGGSAPNKFTGSLQFTRDKVLGPGFPEMFRLDTWILGPTGVSVSVWVRLDRCLSACRS